MKIVIKAFINGEEEATPFWQESAFSVVGAEEALGRLERYLAKSKKEKEALEENNKEE